MSSRHFLIEDMITGKEIELTISSTSLIIVVCYDSWNFGVLTTFLLNSFHINTRSRKSTYHQGPEVTETDFPGGTGIKNPPANQCRGRELTPGPGRSHMLQSSSAWVHHNYWIHTLEHLSCNCWRPLNPRAP